MDVRVSPLVAKLHGIGKKQEQPCPQSPLALSPMVELRRVIGHGEMGIEIASSEHKRCNL